MKLQKMGFRIFFPPAFLQILLSGCMPAYPVRDINMGDNPAILKIERPVNAEQLDHYYLHLMSYKVVCNKPGLTKAEIKDLGYMFHQTNNALSAYSQGKTLPEQVFIPTTDKIIIDLVTQDSSFLGGSRICNIGVQFKPEPNKIYGLANGSSKKTGLKDGYCTISAYEISSDNSKKPFKTERPFWPGSYREEKYICHEDGTYEPQ